MGRSVMRMFDARVKTLKVLVQDIPESLLDAFPDPEEWMDEMMCNPKFQWHIETVNPHMTEGKKDGEFTNVHRSFNWQGDTSQGQEPFCPAFQKIYDATMSHSVSSFIGMHGATGSLDWHVDSYHVWAFNLIGTTTWEWFDLKEGRVKEAVLEPMKNVITMPSGVTHRVKLNSEERFSHSFIQDVTKGDLGSAHTPFMPDENHCSKFDITIVDY